MRSLLSSVLFLSFVILAGCQQPDETVIASDSGDLSPMCFPVKGDSLVLFIIPPIAEIQMNKSDSVVVMPNAVTRLKARLEYLSVDDRYIRLVAEFVVPQHAVSEPVAISMAIDPHTGSLVFQPAGLVFTKSTTLNFFTRNIDPFPENAMVQFVYLRSDGRKELIPFASLRSLGRSGNIDMEGARINHFSRYAFAR